jgi:hypothetical protein
LGALHVASLIGNFNYAVGTFSEDNPLDFYNEIDFLLVLLREKAIVTPLGGYIE